MDDIITKQLNGYRGFNSDYAHTSTPRVDLVSTFDAFFDIASRRALSAINNRVIGIVGTSGPGTSGLGAGNAGTAGIRILNALTYVIDGKIYAGTADTNLGIPASLGTQGTGCYCKYLVSYGTNGTAVITKGNESAAGAIGKYYTLADGSKAPGAFLPDLPEKNCPIGYFVVTTTANKWTAGVGAPATNNTVAYYDLVSMPIFED